MRNPGDTEGAVSLQKQLNASKPVSPLQSFQIRSLLDANANPGRYYSTTFSGNTYLDSISISDSKERNVVETRARQDGIPVVASKDDAESLKDVDASRISIQKLLGQITPLLPTDATGRLLPGAAENKLSALFQTNDQLAAFNSWRTTAIRTLRAAAGSRGLRINQAEVLLAVQNDLPQITDTVGTARQKMANVNAQLDSVETAQLSPNRSVFNNSLPKPTTAAPSVMPPTPPTGNRAKPRTFLGRPIPQ